MKQMKKMKKMKKMKMNEYFFSGGTYSTTIVESNATLWPNKVKLPQTSTLQISLCMCHG